MHAHAYAHAYAHAQYARMHTMHIMRAHAYAHAYAYACICMRAWPFPS